VAPRANWKGFLKVGELTCPVALYTAASASERIAFHTLNRQTGHRVYRQFVDQATQKPVERDQQVKGYEISRGEYVVLEPEEVAATVPESDKALRIEAFVGLNDVDDTYFDRPYYLAPTNSVSEEAFALLREGLRNEEVVALARAVLFRRIRTLLIRPQDLGLVAWTLNFDYEVRSAKDAFGDIAQMKIKGEMLDLAKHIIETKRGDFDPRGFDDRYEAAVTELVRAKLEGKPIKMRKAARESKVIDLMEALRHSAAMEAPAKKAPAKAPSKTGARGGKQAAAKRKVQAQTPRRRKTG
jgi:DNA end-binding protein Ku